MTTISLNLESLTNPLTHDQFYELCMTHKDVAMERSSPQGELIIMPPVGG